MIEFGLGAVGTAAESKLDRAKSFACKRCMFIGRRNSHAGPLPTFVPPPYALMY